MFGLWVRQRCMHEGGARGGRRARERPQDGRLVGMMGRLTDSLSRRTVLAVRLLDDNMGRPILLTGQAGRPPLGGRPPFTNLRLNTEGWKFPPTQFSPVAQGTSSCRLVLLRGAALPAAFRKRIPPRINLLTARLQRVSGVIARDAHRVRHRLLEGKRIAG